VSSLRQLVAGILSWSVGFNSRPDQMGFAEGTVSLEQIFPHVHRFPLSLLLHQCSIFIHLYESYTIFLIYSVVK